MFALSVGACKDATPPEDDGAGDTGSSTGADESAVGESDVGESEGSDGSSSSGGGAADDGPWMSFDERPCPEDSYVTFENFGWPHMLTFCNGCHSSMLHADMRQGSPVEINFDSVEDVRARAERIWVRAGDHNASMPPIGPAADEERKLFGEWLACGAPTNDDLDAE